MTGKRYVVMLVRALVFSVIVTILGYTGYLAWQSAGAFDQHHRVHIAMESWGNSKQQPTRKVWEYYQKLLEQAMTNQPANATFMNTMGRLYLYRAVKLETHPVASAVYVLKAKFWFGKAAALRPAWPYPWLNLVTTGAILGKWSDEYAHAYRMAMQQGRWEEKTMPALVELGLNVYQHLDGTDQAQFRHYITVAMENRDEHLSWLYRVKKLKTLACSLAESDKARSACQ